MAIKLVISGAAGRMGRSIATLAMQDSTFTIAGALEAPGHRVVGQDLAVALELTAAVGVKVVDNPQVAISQGGVLIEFTNPEVTVAHAQLAQQLHKAMVIGTTGLSHAQQETLRLVAKTIPMVVSPNMSLGVNVLFELVQAAAQRLGPAYAAEVSETHHQHKQDSPSGTAKRLAELLAVVRNEPVSQIPIQASRTGEVVGDHTVVFKSATERIELTHRALSRDIFALGALRAAQFVAKAQPGFYTMADVARAR